MPHTIACLGYVNKFIQGPIHSINVFPDFARSIIFTSKLVSAYRRTLTSMEKCNNSNHLTIHFWTVYILVISFKYCFIMHWHSRNQIAQCQELLRIWHVDFMCTRAYHCTKFNVHLSPSAYVHTLCTRLIIYLIYCFACLCVRAYPLFSKPMILSFCLICYEAAHW